MAIQLKKLEGRQGYVGNWMSAKPASWEVIGTEYLIIGRAGAFPSYDIYQGATFVAGKGVQGGKRIKNMLQFEDAKQVVENLTSKK